MIKPLTIDPGQLNQLRASLGTGQTFVRALTAAINRTLRTGAAQVRKDVAQASGLPTRVLGSGTRGIIGAQTANFRRPWGLIKVTNYNIAMHRFRRIGRLRRGMTAALRRGNRENAPLMQVQAHAFRVERTGKVIFARHGGKRRMVSGRYKGKMRQPIYKLYGPSPRKVVEQTAGLMPKVVADLQDTLRRNVQSQINRFMDRRRPSGNLADVAEAI